MAFSRISASLCDEARCLRRWCEKFHLNRQTWVCGKWCPHSPKESCSLNWHRTFSCSSHCSYYTAGLPFIPGNVFGCHTFMFQWISQINCMEKSFYYLLFSVFQFNWIPLYVFFFFPVKSELFHSSLSVPVMNIVCLSYSILPELNGLSC